MIPVVTGVKVTASGAVPLVWLAVKFTVGGGVVTVIGFDRVCVAVPPGPFTVRLTV